MSRLRTSILCSTAVLKGNRFGTFFQRLPSLQLLEKMSEKAALIGMIFLTIAIAIA